MGIVSLGGCGARQTVALLADIPGQLDELQPLLHSCL